MALKLRPTGLGAGIDKDRQGYTVYSGGWDVGRIYEVRGGPEHLRWFWEKRSMRLGRLAGVLVAVLSVILAGSAAICGEWTRWQDANVAAGIEQDGADLVVMCDTRAGRALHPESRGLILMFFREPRANWQKGAQLDVMTITDDGGRWDGPPSHGAAIEPTRVMIQNGATWELWVMGKAKTSFTISAGDYTRTFRAENLRKAVEPVLHECGGPLVDFDACSLIMAIPSVMLPTKDEAVLRTIGEAANYVVAPQGACRALTSSARGNQ